jgi:hypothetical protein
LPSSLKLTKNAPKWLMPMRVKVVTIGKLGT